MRAWIGFDIEIWSQYNNDEISEKIILTQKGEKIWQKFITQVIAI